MKYTIDDPILGQSVGSPAEVFAWLAATSDELVSGTVREYVTEIYRLCPLVGMRADLLVAQSAHETDDWTSYWFRTRKNPVGIGITGDEHQNMDSHTWANGVEAARAHVVHMAAYLGLEYAALTPFYALDPRRSAVFEAGYAGIIHSLSNLTGRWATDRQYAQKIVAKANAIFQDSRIQNQEEPPVPAIDPRIKAKACPVEIWVLTGPSINRPALSMPDASFVTVHEVGNTSPDADEDMHAQFVHNGGGENAVSFHFIVGPTKAIQLVYLNENAWHASDYYSGRGNRDSIAIETVQIGDWAATLAHLSWLIAEIYRNPTRFSFRPDVGRTDDLDPSLMRERTKQHNFWAPDHKNCPQFIRDRGLWTPLLDAVAAELAPVAPQVKRYASPILPLWWSEQSVIDLRTHREDDVLYRPLGTRLTCIAQTGAYQHPWLPEAKGKRTRANIKPGEAVDVRYICNHPETGKQWGITRTGTWISMDKFSPRFTIRTREVSVST